MILSLLSTLQNFRIDESNSPIPHEKIKQRAYERWVARGRPLWDSVSDWIDAENELLAELAATRPSSLVDGILLKLRRVTAWPFAVVRKHIGSERLGKLELNTN